MIILYQRFSTLNCTNYSTLWPILNNSFKNVCYTYVIPICKKNETFDLTTNIMKSIDLT